MKHLYELRNRNDWEVAHITYKAENWPQSHYNEIQRTYKVGRYNKMFQPGMISSSMFGDCLDGKDLGIRLDLYRWEVEKITIVE